MAIGRLGSDKELQAVTVNLKEDKVLDKTRATLDLEQTYALQLIQMTNREVRIHQRSLRSRVQKIKSHLDVEDIADLRLLELQGRFRPLIPTVNLSSTTRIAAAEKRLRMSNTRTSSAQPLHQMPPRSLSRGITLAPSPGKFQQDGIPNPETGPNLVPITTRSPSVLRAPSVMAQGMRSFTSAGFNSERLPQPTRSKTALGYSSHEEAQREEHASSTAKPTRRTSRAPSIRKESIFADGTLLGSLAKFQAADRRQQMIEEQHIYRDELEDKKQDFLTRVQTWVTCTPAVEITPEELTEKVVKSLEIAKVGDPSAPRLCSAKLRRRGKQKVGFTAQDTDAEEVEECKGKLMDLYQEMKTCRYLRLAPEKEDHSGLNTLAKDQFHLLNALRSPSTPINKMRKQKSRK